MNSRFFLRCPARLRRGLLITHLATIAALTPVALQAADHGDSPLLGAIGRNDAKLTDLHAFTHNGNLVIALSTNPAIPPGVEDYLFPSDLTLQILIDNDSRVRFDDPNDLAEFGGTIAKPAMIRPDIVFEIKFDRSGEAKVSASGLRGPDKKQVRLFAGLRDDPFIRAPRQGRNVASIVLEIPLSAVIAKQSTLLIWATSKIPDVQGPICEHAGRALRSMFAENDPMNTLRPRDHFRILGVTPDVMIYDTARPAGYPNGRLLTDDVVDLVGDPRILANDAPFPSVNDREFLADFPYLAPPQ